MIPLGPVTLTGQDYVLVESGCTCRPKYAQAGTDPNPTSIIPNYWYNSKHLLDFPNLLRIAVYQVWHVYLTLMPLI